MSRLLPASRIKFLADPDPQSFDQREASPQLVFLYRRRESEDEGKVEIAFDATDPVAQKYERRLRVINSTNDGYEITAERIDTFTGDWSRSIQLQPFHFANFTEDFEQHGRIYTNAHGHQALRKIERRTIRF